MIHDTIERWMQHTHKELPNRANTPILPIVFFCGPHYTKSSRGKRHGLDHTRFARTVRAYRDALYRWPTCHVIVLVAGDGNSGHDVNAYAQAFASFRIPVVTLTQPTSNTYQDAVRAATAILSCHQAGLTIRHVIYVTHWYHVARAGIALRQSLHLHHTPVCMQDAGSCSRMRRIRPAVVWSHWFDGACRLVGELRGCWDYMLRKPHRTFGKHNGKPALE